jgi:hypothetical protein
MDSMDAYLEKIWGGILSEEENMIRDTFKDLDKEDQTVILAHLKIMISEEGWHPVQVRSASTALKVLETNLSDTEQS